MRNLITLIIKNVYWLFFLLLIALSVLMIINKENSYQYSKYWNLEQEFVGTVFSVSEVVTSYIGLKPANEELTKRVAELESQTFFLKNHIQNTKDSSAFEPIFEDAPDFSLQFIRAKVINNSIAGMNNLITLNKGSADGIEADMGVFSPRGVVGIIMKASTHFSIVIPILNSKSNLSCKIQRSNYAGSLKWDGKDTQFAYLEVPRHAVYSIGDTIVTTGYSSVFPEGIRVGVVTDSEKTKNDNFNSLKIKLLTDFNTLKDVLVVKNPYREEQELLEEDAEKIIKREGL
jgi:rod shape-determining protein MreC